MAPTTEKDDTTTSGSGTSSESQSESTETTSSGTSTESSTSTESTSEEESEPETEIPVTRKKVTRKSSTGTKIVCSSGRKRKRRPRAITVCLTNCRYEIVRRAAKKFNLREVNEDDCWNIYWTDFSVSLERAMDLRRFQIVNHFPGMNEICRKDLLARNLNRMCKLFPKEYDIYPKTWSLPADLGDLQTYAHSRRNKTFICKPEMGCQGRGIFLIRNIKDLNPFGKIICQLYIAKPFLIDDLKFDCRIYVLMTSCDPLRVYVYKEGLARFATAKYKQPTNTNTENSYMHLTNYAVNKFSRDYIVDDEAGTKRKLTAVYRWLEARKYDIEALIESIDSVILKTIISAHPVLRHNYRTCFPNHDTSSACFEILGFDILLDHNLKPFVLEVNHSPSFHTDARLDLEIKEGLVQDTLSMLNLKRLDRHKVERADRKRVQERLVSKHSVLNLKAKKDAEAGSSPLDAQFAFENENIGGFRLIYPKPDSTKYDVYFEQNMSSIYAETTASQARAQLTRNQIQDYNQKKQQEEIKRALVPLKDGPKDKDKLRPESGASTTNPDRTLLIKKYRPYIGNSFQTQNIDPSEELERMKGIMHRGMLVRSLGIEAQVFQLLCQVGTIKPDEERVFRRMYGYTTQNLTKIIAKTAMGSHLNQRKVQTAGGDTFRDVASREDKGGEPVDQNNNFRPGYFPRTDAVAGPGDDSKSFQTTHPHLSGHGGFSTQDVNPIPSQPDAYKSYTIMSQMRKQLSTAVPRKNTVVLATVDNETTTILNSANDLSSLVAFRGESASVKQPSNVWNRYDNKVQTGVYPESRKPAVYAPPKTAILSSGPFSNHIATNGPYSQKRDYKTTTAPYKWTDGENGPWKIGTNNEPIIKSSWTPGPPMVTGTGFYGDTGKSRIHKLIPVPESPVGHGHHHSARSNVHGRGVVTAPKREAVAGVTQMFEPPMRADQFNYYGNNSYTQDKTPAGLTVKSKIQKPSLVQPQSPLMLTGIRIGTAPAARRYGN